MENAKRTRPQLGGQDYRIDNMDIDFEPELETGISYTGEITDSYIFTNGDGTKFMKIVITRDEFYTSEFIQKCPLNRLSPLKPFIAELVDEYGGAVQPRDLLGLEVEFAVYYSTGKNGKEYCNLKSIDFPCNNTPAPTTNDTHVESADDYEPITDEELDEIFPDEV